MARRHHQHSSRLRSHSASDVSQYQQHPTTTPSTTTVARCTSHDDFTLASAGDPWSGSESKEEQAATGSEASASLVAAGKGKRHAGLASLGPQPPLKKICHNTTVVRGALLGQELNTMSSGAGSVDLTLPLTPPSPTHPHNPSLDSPPSPSHPQTPPHDLPLTSHPQIHQLHDHNLTLPTRPVNDLRLASPTVTSASRSSHDVSLTSPSLSSCSIGPSPAGTPTSSSSVSPVHGRCVGASGLAPSSGMESTEEGPCSARTKRRKRNRKNKKLRKRQEQENVQERLAADPGSHPSCPDSSVSEGGAGGVAGLCQDSSESESFSGAASRGVKEEEMNSESEGEQMSGLGDVAADFSGFDSATFSPGVNSFLRNNIASASGSFIRPLVNGVHEEDDDDDTQVQIDVTAEDLEILGDNDAVVGGEMEGYGADVELSDFRVGSGIGGGSSRGVVSELCVSAGSSGDPSGGFGAERKEEGERDETLSLDETKEEQVEHEIEEELAERVGMTLECKGGEKEQVEDEVGKGEMKREGQEISEEECVGEEGRKIDIEEQEGECNFEREQEGVMTDDPSTAAYDKSESDDYVNDDDDDLGSRESSQIVSKHESGEAGEEYEGEITCVSAAGGPGSEQMTQVIINTNLEDINEFQSARVVDHIEATEEGDETIDIVDVTDVDSRGDDWVVDGDKEEELKAGVDEEELREADFKIKVEELEEKEVVGEEKGNYDDDKREEIKQKEAVEREKDEEDTNEEEGGKKEEEEDVAFPVTAPGPQTNGIVGPQEVVTAPDVDIDVKFQVGTTWRDESFTGEKMEVLEVGNADSMVYEVTSEDRTQEFEKPESWMKAKIEKKEEVEEVENQVVKGEMEEEVVRVVGEIVNRVEGEEKGGERESCVKEVGVEVEESRDPGLEVGVSKGGFEAEYGKDDLTGETVGKMDGPETEECKDEGVEVEEREVVGVEAGNIKEGLEVENRIDDVDVRDCKSDIDIEEKKDDGIEIEVSKDGAEVGDSKDEGSEVDIREEIDAGPEDTKENVQEGESRDSFAVEDIGAGFEVVSGKIGVEVESREVPEVEEDQTIVPEEVLMESAKEDGTQQDMAPFGTTITNTLDEGQITGETAVISSPEQYEGETPAAITTTDTSSSTIITTATMSQDTAPLTDAEAAAGDTVNAALASFEELDNIPDGVCESGEVEEEEEEEEEWSYYRMEPQTNTQGEDELVGGVNSGDSNLVKEAASPADHSTYDLLSQPGQSESLIQDIHTTQESYQEVQTTQESFREEFLSKEGKDITGEAKLLDFEYQPLKEEMDSYQHNANTPMEADQPPVMDNSPEILQGSMDNVPEPEISLDTMGKPEISSDKIRGFESSGGGMPDFFDNPAEPSSPHATGSPQMPGSPRSVEGFVTSVELNTPDESLGTNFNINQTQDLNGSGMDQPSGPFSVYVSSSPEPQSLEPSILPSSNGHLEDEGKGCESGDFSPVEIVHAQSTVEVVAPPSPGEKLETEMDFVVPEHTPDLMTTSQMLSDQPTDITFIPEPAIQPVAEVPVPVYLEGTTPVSEGDDQLSESLSTKDDISESDKLPESPVAKMTMSPPPAALEEASIMPQEEMEVVGQVNNGLDFQETPVPIQGETVSPVVSEVIDRQEIKESEAAVLSSEVTSNEVAADISTPEVVASPGLEKKTKVPEAKSTATKSPSKSAKTPVKSSLDKAGKITPAQDTARKTPVSKTPTRTPLAKSTEKKTLASKTDSKPSPTKTTADKPSASRLTSKPGSATKPATTKPATAKPATAKPSTAKPATAKPAAPKPTTTKPAPRTTTSRAATSTLSSTTKPTERKVPKPPTPTAPRASLSKPSSAANKPTTAKPTPITKTTPPTRRPGTAPVKTVTDKTDSGKVNGTSTARPGTRPGTASTMTTATRRPLTTTTRTATKPTAEKETKNTTNRILSTTRTAPKSTVGVTKTASKTSTVAGRSTLTESKNTSRVNGTTSTTTTKSRVTTKSVAAKATDVAGKKGVGSKLKSAPNAKTSPGKAAPIIEASGTTTVVNGENKIAHEETSVEVVEKCAAEDTVMTEKVLAEALTSTTTTQVITTETTEVIVNGDH